jgi:anti-anti-sigma regulatory factor
MSTATPLAASHATGTVLHLPRELTIYTVGELHPRWLDWLHQPGNQVVDGAMLEEADAAGLQLLLSLAKGLDLQARALHLQNPSPALATACAALGLNSLLGAAS